MSYSLRFVIKYAQVLDTVVSTVAMRTLRDTHGLLK
jgi:hypothetical protein